MLWILIMLNVWVGAVDITSDSKAIEKFSQQADCESAATTLNGQRRDGDGRIYLCVQHNKKTS